MFLHKDFVSHHIGRNINSRNVQQQTPNDNHENGNQRSSSISFAHPESSSSSESLNHSIIPISSSPTTQIPPPPPPPPPSSSSSSSSLHSAPIPAPKPSTQLIKQIMEIKRTNALNDKKCRHFSRVDFQDKKIDSI